MLSVGVSKQSINLFPTELFSCVKIILSVRITYSICSNTDLQAETLGSMTVPSLTEHIFMLRSVELDHGRAGVRGAALPRAVALLVRRAHPLRGLPHRLQVLRHLRLRRRNHR